MNSLKFILIAIVIFIASQYVMAFEWEHIGLGGSTVISLAVDPDDSERILAGTETGLYLTSNSGSLWSMKIAANLLFPDVAWAPLATDSILCLAGGGSYSDGIYISENGGIGWSVIGYYVDPRQFGFDMANPGLMYFCFDNGILKSENYGSTFATANNGLPATDISDVMGDGRNGLEAYAAGTNFLVHTDNFANTWSVMTGAFNEQGHFPNRIAYEPSASETLYVSCSQSVAVSYNGGVSWSFTELSESDITPIACNSSIPGELYIGSAAGGGVLKSEDYAVSFYPINSDLANLNVHSLAITPDNYLLAGTANGVYKVNLATVGAGGDHAILPPRTYKISQNYPNPFNASTTFNLNLDPAEHVRLEVFDITGRLVKTLYDHYSEDYGSVSIVWDGTDNSGANVATGVYFYRLITDDEKICKRMTFIK